jgi:acyl-CoA synthetase (AMP-forming)/AMP-acid ligase II
MVTITADERNEYVRAGLWSRTETLSSLLARNARERGDAVAVVDAQGLSYTYAELDRDATALAAALAERGVGRGDAVGVQLPNRAESSVIVGALEKLGAITVPLTPMFREHELCHIGTKTKMVALFVPGTFRRHDFEAVACTVMEQVGSLGLVVSLAEQPTDGVARFATLIEEGVRSARHVEFTDPEIDPDAVTAILMTSGTESMPKAVLHTGNTLYANSRALNQMLELGPDDHIFMASPIGHGTGYGFGTRLAIFLGSKLVLLDQWDPRRCVELISRERCTYTHASTTFAQDLLELDGIDQRDLSSLRWFVSGGASIPGGFAARMKDTIGCELLRLYGQTEAFMTTLNRPDDPPQMLDSRDGRAVPGVELAIWDEEGRLVAPGTAGELVCRGPHCCRGFLDDPQREAKTITADGWLKMGDLGVLDEHGYVQIVGRTKEVISRGGYKFSPREVEEALLEHPLVSRVVLVGVPDRRLGERACACVIPHHGTLTLEDLTSFLRERGFAPYKLPERLELMDAFPLTASGKVQKFELEQRLAAAAE